MHPDQMSLPGFTTPAAATRPLKAKSATERLVKELEERVFNLEFEVTVLKEKLKQLQEDEDE